MTADVELLPCPFCGKSNQDRYPCEWLDGTGANVIRCAWCHGAAPASTWNLRTAPPSAPVGVEKPLPVFSAGTWTYENGQEFSGEDLDGAAFAVYRDHLAQQPAAVDGGKVAVRESKLRYCIRELNGARQGDNPQQRAEIVYGVLTAAIAAQQQGGA